MNEVKGSISSNNEKNMYINCMGKSLEEAKKKVVESGTKIICSYTPDDKGVIKKKWDDEL